MLNFSQLEQLLLAAQTPQQKLRACLRLLYYTIDCEPRYSQTYMEQAFQLAHALNDNEAIAFLQTDRLMMAAVQGQGEAMQEILNGLIVVLFKIKGQILHNFLIASLFSFLASAFENKNYHIKAIHHYYLCLQRVEQIPADEYHSTFFFDIKTKILNNLAYCFMVLERYDQAEAHLQLAEYFFGDLTALPDQIELYHWQARLYEQQHRYQEAIQAANQSIQLSELCPFPVLRNAITYSIKGRSLLKYQQDYKAALYCFAQATQTAIYFDFWLAVANNYEHQARCWDLLEEPQQAIHFYQLALKAQKKTALNYLNQTFRLIRAKLELAPLDNPNNNFSLHQLLAEPANTDPTQVSEAAAIFGWIYARIEQKNLSVENIAAHFQISTRTVNRRLMVLFNTTAAQLISQVRLKKAYVLLTTSQLSIMAIAEKVGIDHLSYFSVSFRRLYGLSPAQIRRQNS